MLNRIFLSADIEGTCGIAHWAETELGKPDYEPFRRQMTREVAAACEGAFAAGCEDLLIKDAHDSAQPDPRRAAGAREHLPRLGQRHPLDDVRH